MDQLVIGVDVGHRQRPGRRLRSGGSLPGPGGAPDPPAPAAAGPCRAQLAGHLGGRLRRRCARRWRCRASTRPPVAGIGFDATCSLVVRDRDGAPVSVSTTGDPAWDTIVWLDHRAVAEAEECTATGHRVLDYVGGVMSPEMEIPKLMWLKRHLPASLGARRPASSTSPTILTWRASGSTARSECTLTCKWTYLAHEAPGWQRDFLAARRARGPARAGRAAERGDADRQRSRAADAPQAAAELGPDHRLPGRRRA